MYNNGNTNQKESSMTRNYQQRVIGVNVSPEQLASVKRQLRERSVKEDRDITVSDAVREALALYGIQI